MRNLRKSILERVMKQTDEQNVQMAESYLNISEHNLKRAVECNSEIDILLCKIEEYKKVGNQFGDMANECYEAMKLKKETENE